MYAVLFFCCWRGRKQRKATRKVDEEKPSGRKEDLSPQKRGGFVSFGKKGRGAKAKPVEILATPDDEDAGHPGGRPSVRPEGGNGVHGRPTIVARVTGGLGRMSLKRFGVRKTQERGLGSKQDHAAKAALKHREAARVRREGGQEGEVQSSAAGTAGSTHSDSDQESPGTAPGCLVLTSVSARCLAHAMDQ